jgi:hypothetical protein
MVNVRDIESGKVRATRELLGPTRSTLHASMTIWPEMAKAIDAFGRLDGQTKRRPGGRPMPSSAGLDAYI